MWDCVWEFCLSGISPLFFYNFSYQQEFLCGFRHCRVKYICHWVSFLFKEILASFSLDKLQSHLQSFLGEQTGRQMFSWSLWQVEWNIVFLNIKGLSHSPQWSSSSPNIEVTKELPLELCLQKNNFGRGICRNKGFPTEFHSIGGYILGGKGHVMLWFNGTEYYSHLAADGTGTSSPYRCFLCCKDLLSCTQPILCFCRAAQTHEEKRMGWDLLFLLMPNQSLAEWSWLIPKPEWIVGVYSDDGFPVSKAFT